MLSEERKAYQREWIAQKRREQRESRSETITLQIPLRLSRKLRSNMLEGWTLRRLILRTLSASVGGEPLPGKTVRRAAESVGRNDPCPCGSGRKFKHCCGR